MTPRNLSPKADKEVKSNSDTVLRTVFLVSVFLPGLAFAGFQLSPPPRPPGLSDPDASIETIVEVTAEQCAIAQLALPALGTYQSSEDYAVQKTEEIRRLIHWEELPAGTAKCDWGTFQTSVFNLGSLSTRQEYVSAFGFNETKSVAAVMGGYYGGPWNAAGGFCVLEKEAGVWSVSGCKITSIT